MKYILFGVPALLAAPLALAVVSTNTAMAAELEASPGIGPAKARAIVAYRQQDGQLKTVEDLKKTKGIGEGIFSKLKDEASAAPPVAKKAVPVMKQQ